MEDIECIICCVNYSDILNVTLPENKKYIKNITVITDSKDFKTHLLCKKYNVKYIVTDVFYDKTEVNFKLVNIFNFQWWLKYIEGFKNNLCFNKAKAINLGIKSTNKNWILLIDADIILPEVITKLNVNTLSKNGLYSCRRYVYDNRGDYENSENGYFDKWQFVGFFQLFNKNSSNFSIDYFGYDESCNYANTSDFTFMNKWNEKKLLKFNVIHLGKTKKNWKGRVTEKW